MGREAVIDCVDTGFWSVFLRGMSSVVSKMSHSGYFFQREFAILYLPCYTAQFVAAPIVAQKGAG